MLCHFIGMQDGKCVRAGWLGPQRLVFCPIVYRILYRSIYDVSEGNGWFDRGRISGSLQLERTLEFPIQVSLYKYNTSHSAEKFFLATSGGEAPTFSIFVLTEVQRHTWGRDGRHSTECKEKECNKRGPNPDRLFHQSIEEWQISHHRLL